MDDYTAALEMMAPIRTALTEVQQGDPDATYTLTGTIWVDQEHERVWYSTEAYYPGDPAPQEFWTTMTDILERFGPAAGTYLAFADNLQEAREAGEDLAVNAKVATTPTDPSSCPVIVDWVDDEIGQVRLTGPATLNKQGVAEAMYAEFARENKYRSVASIFTEGWEFDPAGPEAALAFDGIGEEVPAWLWSFNRKDA